MHQLLDLSRANGSITRADPDEPGATTHQHGDHRAPFQRPRCRSDLRAYRRARSASTAGRRSPSMSASTIARTATLALRTPRPLIPCLEAIRSGAEVRCSTSRRQQCRGGLDVGGRNQPTPAADRGFPVVPTTSASAGLKWFCGPRPQYRATPWPTTCDKRAHQRSSCSLRPPARPTTQGWSIVASRWVVIGTVHRDHLW